MVKNSFQRGYRSLAGWGMTFLWRTSRFHTLSFVLSSFVQVAVEVAQLWVAALVVGEIGTIIISRGTPDKLYLLAASSIALRIVDKIAWTLLWYHERQLYLKGSSETYRMFNTKLSSLSVSQHHSGEIRKLIDRLDYEGYAWKPLNFSFSLLYAIHALTQFLTSSIILITQLPLVVLLLVIGVAPTMFIQRKSGDLGWGIWGDVGDKSRIFWGVANHLSRKETIEEIIPQRSAPYLLKRAHEAIDEYTTKAMAIRKRFAQYSVVGAVFEMIMAGVSYVWFILQAVAGKLAFDSFVFMSSLIWQTLSSVRLVVNQVADALQNVPFMRDFIAFSELKNDLPMAENPLRLGNEPLTIEFQNVSFAYPGHKRHSIKNVSLTLQPGDHVALVGLNGAGKTTFIRLLLRFYDPTEGRILVNGTDLREIDLDSYYKHIGTLFQSFNKYPLEFMKNITLSNDTDTKRYKQALEISGADEVLAGINGEDTYLQPEFIDGTELSGGQWQRVALARNIYAASDVYILDEPTSAIDALSEQKIFDKLYKELEGKSLITVSHRFNTVRRADEILVLENGRITEQGAHSELMKRKGPYFEMYTAQAEGYNDK